MCPPIDIFKRSGSTQNFSGKWRTSWVRESFLHATIWIPDASRRAIAANFAANSLWIRGKQIEGIQFPAYLLKETFYHEFSFLLWRESCLLSLCRYLQHLLSEVPFLLLSSVIREFSEQFAALSLCKQTAISVVAIKRGLHHPRCPPSSRKVSRRTRTLWKIYTVANRTRNLWSCVRFPLIYNIKLATKGKESHQLSIIQGKDKWNHDMWSHRKEWLWSHCLDESWTIQLIPWA